MIRGALGSRYGISPLGRGVRRPAAGGWWLSGGIAAANCIAAYQPKGAADYATSKVNLANPGTYDAADGAAYPTWDSTNGWKFLASSSQYLDTGIAPADGYSVAFRFTDATSEGYPVSVLQNIPNNCYFELNARLGTDMRFLYGDKVLTVAGGAKTSGLMIMTPTNGYYNGSSVGSIPAYTWNGTAYKILIGARNVNGTPSGYSNIYVQAVAFYNINISSYVAALNTAMAAL